MGKFLTWLIECGAEIETPHAPNEALRVVTCQGIFVVQRSHHGDIWPEKLLAIARHYRNGSRMELAPFRGEKRHSRLRDRYDAIVTRDGCACFYCGRPVRRPDEAGPDEMAASIEHLVPRAQGGPNHLANCFVAHAECNKNAGNLSAPEKIAMRDAIRLQATTGDPP